MSNLTEFGISHGVEGLIHLQKWIRFQVIPNIFDRSNFIEANKNWLCHDLYKRLKEYLIENNLNDVIWEKDFLDLKQNEPYPSGIIYFDKIPIRWMYGALLTDAISPGIERSGYRFYVMSVDFIGRGVKKLNE